MTIPTREEVLNAYDDLNNYLCTEFFLEKLDVLKDAYLAQEKELEASKKLVRDMEECVDNVREAMGLESTHLEAEGGGRGE